MTKEQAIEMVNEFTKIDFNNENDWTGYYDSELKELQEALETVLNMLKEKDKKIEKKDKIIDLMAEYIGQDMQCIRPEIECNKMIYNCKDCAKQYFERKAEEC